MDPLAVRRKATGFEKREVLKFKGEVSLFSDPITVNAVEESLVYVELKATELLFFFNRRFSQEGFREAEDELFLLVTSDKSWK
jgi:hypothetical protein